MNLSGGVNVQGTITGPTIEQILAEMGAMRSEMGAMRSDFEEQIRVRDEQIAALNETVKELGPRPQQATSAIVNELSCAVWAEPVNDAVCDYPVRIIYGSISFNADNEHLAQQFIDGMYRNVSFILGSVTIQAFQNLAFLRGLKVIGGSLTIYTNDQLTTLSGLDSVGMIGGDLNIHNNAQLTTLSGLDSVAEIGEYLNIFNNGNCANTASAFIQQFFAAQGSHSCQCC